MKNILTEINMSPGAMADFLKSPAAQNIMVGFEAEIICDPEETFGINLDAENNDELNDTMPLDWRAINRVIHDVFEDWNSDLDSVFDAFSEQLLNFIKDEFDHEVSEYDIKERMSYMLDMSLSDVDDHEKLDQMVNAKSDEYESARDELLSEFEQDWDDMNSFLSAIGIRTIGDFGRVFNLHFPQSEEGEVPDSVMIAFSDKFADDFGVQTAWGPYHHAQRGNDIWSFEPDSSTEGDAPGQVGIEIISPPMPLSEAYEMMTKVFEWCHSNDFYSNKSTGLHVGVSLKGLDTSSLDVTKLVLFLGDQHVLRDFEREMNSMCYSLYKKTAHEVRTQLDAPEKTMSVLDDLRKGINHAAKTKAVKLISAHSDRYVSINVKGNYVEFRSMGGNYLEYINTVRDTMLRFCRVMSIAYDPEAEKKEYAKKLYKLIVSNGEMAKTDQSFDAFAKIFTLVRTGGMTKQAGIQKLAALQKLRKSNNIGEITVNLINRYSEPDASGNVKPVKTYTGRSIAGIIGKIAGEWGGGDLWKKFFIAKRADTGEQLNESVQNNVVDSSNVLRHVSGTVDQFEKDLIAKYGLRSLHLFLISNNVMKIGMIAVAKDDQGRGTGSSVMKEITHFADQHGLKIVLRLGGKDDGFGTTSTARLTRFYKKFGFVKNSGRYKDFSLSADMYRNPGA